jgi:hypothetical protein
MQAAMRRLSLAVQAWQRMQAVLPLELQVVQHLLSAQCIRQGCSTACTVVSGVQHTKLPLLLHCRG